MSLDWNVRGELTKWTSLSGTVAMQDYSYDSWGERRERTNPPAGSPSGFQYTGANRGKDLTTGMDSYVMTAQEGAVIQNGRGDVVRVSNAYPNANGSDWAIRGQDFDPFGRRLWLWNAGPGAMPQTDYGFTGREEDGSGLVFMRNRYYHPELGRFISQDPIGFAGGLNLYAYCGNDPINFTDPLGLYRMHFFGLGGYDYDHPFLSNEDPDPYKPSYRCPDNGELSDADTMHMRGGRGFRPGMHAGTERSNYAQGRMREIRDQYIGAVGAMATGGLGLLGAELAEGAAATGGSKPFALGIDGYLDEFAVARGADTSKGFPDVSNWKSGVLGKLADPNTQVHFNLDGVSVWQGIQRAASGRGGATDWELLTIRENPSFWDSLTFWKDGTIVGNPFN